MSRKTSSPANWSVAGDYRPKKQTTNSPVIIALVIVAVAICIACVAIAAAFSALMDSGQPTDSKATGPITVTLLASPEKRELLTALTDQFNQTKPQVDGRPVKATVTFLESGEILDAVIGGDQQPVALSPASSTWLNQLNDEWKTRTNSDNLLAPNPRPLFVSPIVIAMWEPLAQAMGYPHKPVGWADVIRATLDPAGWGAYGHPEWGKFKFSHASVDTDSGRLATLAAFFAAANKVRGLTEADLANPAVRDYVRNIEKGIVYYGESDKAIADTMAQRGRDYLSAAVLEEKTLIQFNLARPKEKLVAIYPAEGTFWADHPYVTLAGDWVSLEQAAASRRFMAYLLSPEAQAVALKQGFRPGNLDLTLANSPISPANGADPNQPKTLLAIPDAKTLAAVRNVWALTKKPANLWLVADISGSMADKGKIDAAKGGLLDFVKSIASTDKVGLITFSDVIRTPVPLATLDEVQRNRLNSTITGLQAGGNTALYAVTRQAVDNLVKLNNKDSINAVVLMTDGKETTGGSKSGLVTYLKQVTKEGEKSGVAIKVFTVAYGSDADLGVLTEIAEATGGKAVKGDTETVRKLYRLLSTYF